METKLAPREGVRTGVMKNGGKKRMAKIWAKVLDIREGKNVPFIELAGSVN